MLGKLKLLYSTVKHLKPIQISYQVLYRLNKPRALKDYQKNYDNNKVSLLSFEKVPPVYENWLGKKSFNFLNLSVDFGKSVNWNFQEHGKLWNYNLQYANYLLQENIELEDKVELLKSLYSSLDNGKLLLEPYPASLRSINVIRLWSLHNIKDSAILEYLHGELDFLSKRLEYHLLGNHLLENVFALLMGGVFFSEENWVKKGKEVLKEQLKEQVLSDGGHFELSPMYHQIILFRVLELLDWYSKIQERDAEFDNFLQLKAEIMCSWLQTITFDNGDIPHFNDSAEGISYSTEWLLNYARSLNITLKHQDLSSSGYRAFNNKSYECRVDCGKVGPSYQPGHAHADALSFILYYRNNPLFVEKGTSTYQIGEIRSDERATSSHNTVVVNKENQSRVWGGFRVAERANVKILEDKADYLSVQHDGYQKYNLIHKRTFGFSDKTISVTDELKGNDSISKEFHLHVFPGLDLKITNNIIEIEGGVKVVFDNHINIRVDDYEMANGYNQYRTGKKIVTTFANTLNTEIVFN